jgi:hypothetical protein
MAPHDHPIRAPLLAALLGLVVGLAAGVWLKGASTTGQVERRLAGHEARLDEIRTKHTSLDDRLADVEPAMKRALEETARSVYLVALVEPDGEPVPLASAWLVAPATLVTNAHVAEAHGQQTPGQRMIVRSSDSPPRDFEVERVTLHPGYAAFDRLWREYEPLRALGPGSFEVLRGIPACDVGLLHVTAGEGLGEPLRIASPPALTALASGDAVGFAGYPTEAMAIGGVNVERPTPTVQVGHVTAVTDFFLGKDVTGGGLLVQHSLPVAGGASGSPVVGSDGQVVAVLSGGNLVATPAGRVATGVGVNFAQRADLVLELLSGDAEAIQSERTRRWEESIRQFRSLRAVHAGHAKEAVEQIVSAWATSLGAWPVLEREVEGRLSLPDARGRRTHVTTLAALRPAQHLVVGIAQSHGADIDLYVESIAADGRRTLLGKDEAPDGFPAVSLALATAINVEATVVGAADTAFTLQLYGTK